jgi:hypothetical protein
MSPTVVLPPPRRMRDYLVAHRDLRHAATESVHDPVASLPPTWKSRSSPPLCQIAFISAGKSACGPDIVGVTPAAVAAVRTAPGPGVGVALSSIWNAPAGSPNRSWGITCASILSENLSYWERAPDGDDGGGHQGVPLATPPWRERRFGSRIGSHAELTADRWIVDYRSIDRPSTGARLRSLIE